MSGRLLGRVLREYGRLCRWDCRRPASISALQEQQHQSSNQSQHQSSNQFQHQSSNQSSNQSHNQSQHQSSNQSHNQSQHQSSNQSHNQSQHQSSNQSSNQSHNQSQHQSSNQSHNQNVAQRYVLGIETSCDDTGVAIVDESGRIISEVMSSQLAVHIRNGGIIPPIARDMHREKIESVVAECLQKSGLDPSQLSAVAVTYGPGLALSLLVGLEYAKKMAKRWKKPLIPVHHMEAHALTIRMVDDVDFPFIVVLISGGHSLIALAEDIQSWQLYGTTLDDAPGEALDKTARYLRLSNLPQYAAMSGGAAMEHISRTGDRSHFAFPVPMSHYRDCDTSFSGLKTAAKKHILREDVAHNVGPDGVIPTAHHLCASFLHSIGRSLGQRLERAIVYCNQNEILPVGKRKVVLSGGVACNAVIREMLGYIAARNHFTLHVPPPKLCCDNGVMIAWNGMEKLRRGVDLTWDLDTVDIASDLPFGRDVRETIRAANIKVSGLKFPPRGYVHVEESLEPDAEFVDGELDEKADAEDVPVK